MNAAREVFCLRQPALEAAFLLRQADCNGQPLQ